MVRRPGSESDRLTLSGLSRLLKRSLVVRCQRQGTSQEKMVVAILERELAPEMAAIQEMDRKLETVQ